MLAMGQIPDPEHGRPIVRPDIARQYIDLVGLLQEKTKGNLTEDEQKTLATTLYELRASYVQIANAARSPATGGPSQPLTNTP